MVSNISTEPRLSRSKSFTFRHFLQLIQQLAEIFLAVQPLFAVLRPHFHQQPTHLVLHPHRLRHYHVPVAQQPSQFAHLLRRHIAGWKQIATHQVGDFPRIQLVVFVLGWADGFHHRRIADLQRTGKRLQCIVYPAAEQRRLHRAVPWLLAFPCPLPQHHWYGTQYAFFVDVSVGSLHAVADSLLVNIESDIVFDSHWVLLI
jgi:hypothetical protein